MERITIQDGVRSSEFMGVLLGESTTDERGERLRWTELRLYRMATDEQVTALGRGEAPGEPSGDYLVHSLGLSLYYHRDEGGCGKGTPMAAGELSGDREACEECWPDAEPVLLDPAMQVRAELDRGYATRCASAADVADALEEMTTRIRRPGRSLLTRRMSGPASDLLVDAARRDPAIADVLHQPVPLTRLPPEVDGINGLR